MAKKASLKQLHKQLGQSDKPAKAAQKTSGEASPPRGDRGDFLKITITLPPETLQTLRDIGMARRCEGRRDTDVSSLIRESLATFIENEG